MELYEDMAKKNMDRIRDIVKERTDKYGNDEISQLFNFMLNDRKVMQSRIDQNVKHVKTLMNLFLDEKHKND